MGKKRKLAGRLNQARVLRMIEEDARSEGEEKLALARECANKRAELMKAIKCSVMAGNSTGVPVIDGDIKYLNDELEPPPPEAHRQLPRELFRPA